MAYRARKLPIRYETPRRPVPGERPFIVHIKRQHGGLGAPTAALVACLAVAGIWSSPARAQTPSEYEMKAVFLYNFAKFVEWPAEASGTPDPAFSICVVGTDPFGASLDQAVRGKSISRRSVTLRRVREAREARTCQIAFISPSERRRLRPILDSLGGSSILTVGDTEGFAEQGGMINFTLEDNRVHFEVNVDAAQRAGLKMSSKLLGLARIVKSKTGGRKG